VKSLLDIQRLTVGLSGEAAPWIDELSFSLQAGEALAVLGRSGSGKSTLALTVMNLLPPRALRSGEIAFKDERLDLVGPARWREIRGREIAMVVQESQSALNPVRSIGSQLGEVIARCSGSKVNPRQLAEVLEQVNLDANCLHSLPSELSGGMRQRVVFAMALACKPTLLLADEPTAGLDDDNQRLIVERLKAEQERRGLAVMLITHDFALAKRCERTLVLANGRCVDSLESDRISVTDVQQTQELLRAATALGRL